MMRFSFSTNIRIVVIYSQKKSSPMHKAILFQFYFCNVVMFAFSLAFSGYLGSRRGSIVKPRHHNWVERFLKLMNGTLHYLIYFWRVVEPGEKYLYNQWGYQTWHCKFDVPDERKGWVDMVPLLLLSILAVSDLSLLAQGKTGGRCEGGEGDWLSCCQVPVRTPQLRQGRRFSATTRAR